MSRRNNDITNDGRKLSEGVRDVSSSASKYILAGDPTKEVYRLFTFNDASFPAVDKHKLSQAGFYSTGYKDRVKCFSCGVQCENWATGDNPFDQNYHFVSCQHVNNSDPNNIEIERFFTKAFRVRPETTASSNQPSTSQRPPSNSSQRRSTTTSKRYLCLHPSNPHMRLVEVRLETFVSGNWPSQHIRATPREIAIAGMFYLGSRDRVKCWYCNGGLQNWDTSDDPWFEHAKWFPQCEFLLQSKGDDFVQYVVAIYPNLDRPNFANSQSNTAGTPSGSSNEILIVDPRASTSKAESLADNVMASDPNVTVARSMNFEESSIKCALTRQFAENGRSFDNAEQLIDAILFLDESANLHSIIPPSQSVTVTTTTNVFTELQEIQNNMHCKLCKTNLATEFTLPCGHLCTCKSCIENVQRCPICNIVITEKRHIFRV